jgi:hypothetical protein
MAVFKHLEEIEKKYSAFEAEYRMLFSEFFMLNGSDEFISQTKLVENEFSSFKENCAGFREIFEVYKKNPSSVLVKNLQTIFRNIVKNLKRSSRLIFKAQSVMEKNQEYLASHAENASSVQINNYANSRGFFLKYKNHEFYLLKTNNTYMNKTVQEQIEMLLESDYKVLRAGEQNNIQNTSIVRKMFPSLRRRLKKTVVFNAGKTEVTLRISSKFNISRNKFEYKFRNQDITTTIIGYVDGLCTSLIEDAKKKEISQEFELHLSSIKKLIISKKYDELSIQITEHFILLLQNFLVNHSKLLRSSKVNIFMELNSLDAGGFCVFEASTFSSMFLKISIDQTLLKSFVYNLKVLSKDGYLYDTLAHEFTHAYDWVLNSKTEYELAFSILNEEPTMEAVILTRMILWMRMESLAGLNAMVNRSIKDKAFCIFPVHDLLWNFADFQDYVLNIGSFFEYINAENFNAATMNKKAFTVYNNSASEFFGYYISAILLINELQNNAKYFYAEQKPLNDNPFNMQISDTMENLKLKQNVAGVWLDYGKVGKVLGTALTDADSLKKKYIYIVANKEVFMGVAQNLVSKISLMNPNDFLNGFIDAAKSLKIYLGPVFGIKSGAIRKNLILYVHKQKVHRIKAKN